MTPCEELLKAARESDMFVIHTREGHRPCLSDLHPSKEKKLYWNEITSTTSTTTNPEKRQQVIGTSGPNGRILVRGEPGHGIITRLQPLVGKEPVIDKPGKGSFYATDLDCILKARDIRYLIICGVTTEVCVHTTIREANDRGYYCIAIGDCCASYNDQFHHVALEMIIAQNGIFGSLIENASTLIDLLEKEKVEETSRI